MEYVGYLAAVAIGISLGLIGGGGSILTLPVLLYFFGLEPQTAIVCSLFVVGISSLVGSFGYIQQKLADYTVFTQFGIPSVFSVFIARKFLVPVLPKNIRFSDSLIVNTDSFLVVLFGLVMLMAGTNMIRKRKILKAETSGNALYLVLYGLGIGLLTGILGAGGGFLIIPLLVSMIGLEMKKAVGTSLMIIALNTLLGFVFSIGKAEIDWFFLGLFSLMAVAGIVIGMQLSKKVDGALLKPAFGIFIIFMAVWLISGVL